MEKLTGYFRMGVKTQSDVDEINHRLFKEGVSHGEQPS